MTRNRYTVRVTKDTLVFSSGHFITYDGDHCERIHGHNYRVAVEVEDELDANAYVFDFITLKEVVREVTDRLDHRMLLSTENPLIRLVEDGPNIKAIYKDRYWSFPREEVVLLPIANTTAELLGDYLGRQIRAELERRGLAIPRRMRVEVEECFGQVAACEWSRDES